jgi:xanthine dehydrogenase molybdopterin-binding subunit B
MDPRFRGDDSGVKMNITSGPLIGQPVERAEDQRFLTGTGKYVDDLVRPDLLHAVVLRSSVAHGHIKKIDASAARARPGVHAVITAAEIGADIPVIPIRLANMPGFQPYVQPVIAHQKVRYVGEPIALVVAQTQALAEDALEVIDVRSRACPQYRIGTRRRPAPRCCLKRPAATARCAIRSLSATPRRLSPGPTTPVAKACAATA